MIRKNSLRRSVILRCGRVGKPNWSLKKTINVCIEESNKFEIKDRNPAPKFHKAIMSNDVSYIRRWVLGCHFFWLNPR